MSNIFPESKPSLPTSFPNNSEDLLTDGLSSNFQIFQDPTPNLRILYSYIYFIQYLIFTKYGVSRQKPQGVNVFLMFFLLGVTKIKPPQPMSFRIFQALDFCSDG